MKRLMLMFISFLVVGSALNAMVPDETMIAQEIGGIQNQIYGLNADIAKIKNETPGADTRDLEARLAQLQQKHRELSARYNELRQARVSRVGASAAGAPSVGVGTSSAGTGKGVVAPIGSTGMYGQRTVAQEIGAQVGMQAVRTAGAFAEVGIKALEKLALQTGGLSAQNQNVIQSAVLQELRPALTKEMPALSTQIQKTVMADIKKTFNPIMMQLQNAQQKTQEANDKAAAAFQKILKAFTVIQGLMQTLEKAGVLISADVVLRSEKNKDLGAGKA
jgi:hypothetical protein